MMPLLHVLLLLDTHVHMETHARTHTCTPNVCLHSNVIIVSLVVDEDSYSVNKLRGNCVCVRACVFDLCGNFSVFIVCVGQVVI